jgi:hypothetical protein
MLASDDRLRTVRIPLSWLQELDGGSSPKALPDAFGDTYLFAHNPTFRNVRDAAIEFGYGFSCSDTPLWRDYHSFPLLTLHQIISGKVIPYFDTAGSFRRLVGKDQSAALPLRFIYNNMAGNHVFHESGHCVAHEVLLQLNFAHELDTRSKRECFVLCALLEESFANAVEMLGNAFVKSLLDGLFYSLNSFTSARSETKEILKRSGHELGAELRFAVLYLAYLEANLCAAAPSERTYARIARIAQCPNGAMDIIRGLTDIAFSLNLSFRRDTTPVYFDLLGHGEEYRAVIENSWLEDDVHASAICQLLPPLQRIALQGSGRANASAA